MTTYFTAASDDEAASAIDTTPVGNEVLTSVVAPDSDAFTALIQLILGTEIDGLQGDDFSVYQGVATSGTTNVVRLSSDLVAEIADRDAVEFAELERPWHRSGALDVNGGVEVADYLIDLQHLSRNAIAQRRGVYAVGSR